MLPCCSGLASSQHYSRLVLGGQRNLLARADPLCNVVAGRLEAAQRWCREQDAARQPMSGINVAADG